MIDAQTLRQMDDLVDLRNAHYQTLNELNEEHRQRCAPLVNLINELDLAIGTIQTEWLHSGHSDFSGITLDEVNVDDLPDRLRTVVTPDYIENVIIKDE